jgi:ATP-binding cassette subfamily F protein 3
LDWEAKKEAEKIKRKAEKRWTEIEMTIADLDIKVAGLDLELCQPETYADAENSTRLAREKREAEAELALLYQELEELESQGHGK